MRKAAGWLPLLIPVALLALLAALLFSPKPTNEDRIAEALARQGYRPRESYQADTDEAGADAPYISLVYGHLQVEDGWGLMVFPTEKHGVAFEAQRLELALFRQGEDAPQVFTYGPEELAAALTWSDESVSLSTPERNRLFLSRAIVVGREPRKAAGKTRFGPCDAATLLLAVPHQPLCEGLGVSLWGTDAAGTPREYHNYLTLPPKDAR